MAQDKTFEEKLERLQKIAQNIEEQNLSLQETLAIYEEGSALVKALEEELNVAMKKFDMAKDDIIK